MLPLCRVGERRILFRGEDGFAAVAVRIGRRRFISIPPAAGRAVDAGGADVDRRA